MESVREKLNSVEYLPAKAYRRNDAIYELVCYVNCLVGCRLSENLESADVFKARAEQFISKNLVDPEYETYVNLVKEYLRASD